jgi:hypothetical protein
VDAGEDVRQDVRRLVHACRVADTPDPTYVLQRIAERYNDVRARQLLKKLKEIDKEFPPSPSGLI